MISSDTTDRCISGTAAADEVTGSLALPKALLKSQHNPLAVVLLVTVT